MSSKSQPFIYVFLKNESGVTISLIQLFSSIPMKQNHKLILNKVKLPKNKVLSLNYKSHVLSDSKSLKEEGVANFGDVYVNLIDETPPRTLNSDKVPISQTIVPQKPLSIQPKATNQVNQAMKPNWSNFGLNDIVSNKNVMPATVNAMIDQSISLSGPLEEKKSLKKVTNNIMTLTKNIKNLSPNLKKPVNDKRKPQSSANEKAMIKKISMIQALYKAKKARKIYAIRLKKLKYRVFIIDELITSEEKYKNSLFCIKNNVIMKFREKKFLSKEEEYTIFSTLENIAEFSENFHMTLNIIYKGKFVRYQTKIAETVLKMMPYFKLYTPYFNNFDHSRQCLEKLKKNNSKISAWLNENDHKTQLENQDLSSLLIKPIQRLPKYVLLFKDLKKNTEETHPDYQYIVQALEKFEVINNELNSQMKEYLRKIKIFELQQTYGNSNKLQILEAGREFLDEEAISIILRDTPRQGILYFLTDLLIVGERVNNDWKLIKAVYLDSNSFIREQQDTQYFENVFSVYGKETITLCTDSKENKLKLMAVINLLIKDLKSKYKSREGLKKFNKGKTLEILKNLQMNPVTIKVIGTIKRGLKNFSPYTVYVIQISKNNWNQCVYQRYSELLKLDEMIKKEHSGGIAISHFPPKNWLNGQKPQVIESRKLLIEPFLQTLLQNEKIIDNNRKVLNFLGLPLNFYDMDEISNKEKGKMEQKESYQMKHLLKTTSVLGLLATINANKEALKAQNIRYTSQNTLELHLIQDIEVNLMNGQKVNITINKTTKASDLCRDIASCINLTSWLDFKLFLSISNNEERRLEDDEFIYRVITSELKDNNAKTEKMDDAIIEELIDSGDERSQSRSKSPQKEKSKISSFFSGIKDTFNKGFKKIKSETRKLFSSEYKLVFKKYLYFDTEIEQIDYNVDHVKLDLLTCQIFKEVFQLYYIISFNDYCLLSALRTYLTYGSISDIKPNEFDHVMEEKSLKESIPDEVYYKKEKEFWVNSVGDHWKSFSEEIIKRADENKQMNMEKNSAMLKSFANVKSPALISHNINVKQTDYKIIAKFLTVDSISKSQLYGSRCFWVNYEGPTQKKSKDFGYLAVSFNKISLLNPKKVQTNQVMYENVKDYKTFPDSFELTFESNVEEIAKQRKGIKFLSFHADLDDSKANLSKKSIKEDITSRNEIVSMRFYTANSFEIYQLIEMYRKMRDAFKEKEILK